MTTGPNTHTFSALMQNWQNRLVAVERRLARTAAALPGRLQPFGQEVVDWDEAVEVGFYWGNGALNAPTAAGILVVGVVTATDTRLVQEIWSASVLDATRVNTWRRVRSGTWSAWAAVGAGYNAETVLATTPPNAFPLGYSYGLTGSGFPTIDGTVETIFHGSQGIQRVTQRVSPNYEWVRGAVSSGTAWSSVWTLLGGDTGWQNITAASGWSSTGLQYKINGGMCVFRGEVWGGTDATTLFTMPVGARPVGRLSYIAPRIVTATVPPSLSINIQTTGVATGVVFTGGTVLTGSPGYSLGAFAYPVE